MDEDKEIDLFNKIKIERDEIVNKVKTMGFKQLSKKIVSVLVIVMLCVVSFLFGYAQATQNTVNMANDIIVQFIKNNKQIKTTNFEPIVSGDFVFDPATEVLINLSVIK